MKKLMIALAAVVTGVAVQASTVNWSCASVIPQKTGDDVTTYMAYIIDNTDYAQSDVTDKTVGAAIAVAAYNQALAVTSSSNPNGKIGTGSAKFDDSYISGDKPTYYLVILNGTDTSDASHFLVSNTKQGTVSSAGGLTMSFQSMSGYTWTAIAPEPTSGLLMLLGMAGLALRRRRA